MNSVYIPDLTERFPEGFGGVDLTDRYFPDWKGRKAFDLDAWEYLDKIERKYSEDSEE